MMQLSNMKLPTGLQKAQNGSTEPLFQPHQTSIISLSYFGVADHESKDFIHDILKEFTQTVPSFLSSLEAAINTSDFSSIKSLIHDMKATVYVLGFADLVQNAIQFLESSELQKNPVNSMLIAFQHIKNIYQQALEEAVLLLKA